MAASAGRWGVPSTSGMLSRCSLLQRLLDIDTRPILFVAASGFGKTVTAAQLASQVTAPSLWVSAAGATSVDEILGMLARIIRAKTSGDGDSDDGDVLTLKHHLASLGISDAWLFIDDYDAGARVSSVSLAQELRSVLGPFVRRVVVTSRAIPAGHLVDLTEAVVVDEHLLALTLQEAKDFGGAYGCPEDESQWEELWRVYSGHPALVRMAVTFSSPPSDGSLVSSPDLAARALVEKMVLVHLSTTERAALISACLFREGATADLETVYGASAGRELAAIASRLPLVRVWVEPSTQRQRFAVHDLVVQCLLSSAGPEDRPDDVSLLNVSRILAERGHWRRSADVLRRLADETRLIEFVEENAALMIEDHQSVLLLALLDRMPLNSVMSRPKVLLAWSNALHEAGQLSQSVSKAAAASRVAQHERDYDTFGLAISQRIQAQLDQGRAQEAVDTAADACESDRARMSSWVLCELLLSEGLALGVLERRDEAIRAFAAGETVAVRDGARSMRTLARLRRARAYADALWYGDFSRAARHTAPLLNDPANSFLVQQSLRGNLAWMLMETGRLERAESLVQPLAATGNELLSASYLPVLGGVAACRGEFDRSWDYLRLSQHAAFSQQDEADLQVNRLYESCMRLAHGQIAEALNLAERSFESLSDRDFLGYSRLAAVEVGACLLALRDVRGSLLWLGGHDGNTPNAYHRLCATCVKALAAHFEGGSTEGVELLRQVSEYIESGNANWRLAMYCRAFPELLGLVSMAIGVERLPVHMLRMLLPEDMEKALNASKGFMDGSDWIALGKRVLGVGQFESFVQRAGRPICRVRLFGGLEVRVGERAVQEKDWKKRKARLLFAMLVARRGQDVARDQILDHLWPDLTEEKAKNNFYVAWSTMKSALMPADAREGECPYVESRRGRCRLVTESVRSDIDEFEELMAEARRAESEDDDKALVSTLHRLIALYRGDLLPGDVYDDWFASLRDKYRFDFIDALARGADFLLEHDEPTEALVLLRRALAADPYREDLYQAAMRCHISAGQRSAAIETYIECKSQLAEQLGLDPAGETMQLYQQILGMENRPRYDSYGLS